MRDEPTATHEITDDDRERAMSVDGLTYGQQAEVARLLAEVRAVAHAAGVESCNGAADDARASGFAEGHRAGLGAAAERLRLWASSLEAVAYPPFGEAQQ
jgi:hypothetical protein